MKADRTLDCTGLFCPMPVVKARLELETMKPGEALEIISDDAGFEGDLTAWCRLSGEKFLGIEKERTMMKGYVRKRR